MTWLPLSPAQEGMLFGHLTAPNPQAYTTAEVTILRGALDVPRFQRAVALVYERVETLRVRFWAADGLLADDTPAGALAQRVIPAVASTHLIDMREDEVPEQAADEYIARDLDRPLDVFSGEVTRSVLIRVDDHQWWWYHAAHHAVVDGVGVARFLQLVSDAYRDGVVPPVASVEQILTDPGGDGTQDLAGWLERLRPLEPGVTLAGHVLPPEPRSQRAIVSVDADITRGLRTTARMLGTTWVEVVHAVCGWYHAWLMRHRHDAQRARIGVPIMNRTLPGVGVLPAAGTPTMAMNIVPITVSWQPEHSVDAALAAFREEFRWAVAHPWARHERVSRTFQQRHRVAQQLFGPLVNVIPTALNLTLDGVETSTFNASAGPVEDMTFTVRGNPGQGLSIEVDVNPKLYTQTEASGHAQRITDWLRRITLLSGASLLVELTEPTRQLPHQSPLEAWEHDLVIQSFNATAQPVRARTLADAFAQQVERTPDAEALVYDGRRWTYAQFDAAVTAVAQHVHTALEKAGLDPSVPHAVGVSLTRGPELLAAVHGVHRAGHAYVALDPNDPELRTEAKCADANCRIVLDGRLDDFDALVATGERLMRDESGQTWRTPVMDDPAYVLFTSGSTGRPKGVVVSHRAICNRLEWMQHEFPTGVGDAVVHKTPVTFDVSVWELFWPLQTGATLVIAAPEGHRDPHYLHQLLIGERVKVVHFVPSMLRAFLAHIAEQPHAARPAELRHVICSGEALSSDLVNGARTVLGVDPINLYGPTEAAVDVTYWYTDADRDRHVVPIGYPVWNTQCYVLDARQRPVPIGFPGELYLGGVQLADGYAGQPETTAAAFLTVPGENLGLAQDQRLYRTGDVAAWRWDGSLEYLGRSDDQIKIRGQRIELGEVDAAFLSAPGIADAAVVPHDYGGETQLVAHVVPTNQNVSSTVIAGDDSGATSRWTQALLAHLRRHLTDAMLPIGLVTHQRLPLSSSGKTSRRELSQNQDIMLWASLISGHTGIAEHPMQENAASEAYSDATVLATTQAFTEVLGMHIGPHDDFFLCGGHSLRALQAVNRINRTGLWRVTVADIFAHPTPYTLASHLKESGRTAQTAVNLLRGPSSDEQAGAPVFLLPPAGGLGWCYTPLARALDGERDVYALSMVELLNQEEAPVNLQELAQAFHEQIRSVVGDQPFHIAGWSLGGMAAHTLGALAVESEANVLSVGILDAYPGSCWRDEPIPGRAEAWRAVLRMAGLEPERVLVAFTQHEPELSREDEETLRGELLSEDSLLFGLGAEFIDAALATVRRSAEIIRNSANQAPLLAPIPVLHIQAVQNARFTPDAWTDLTPNGIEFHAVDSTHPGMMRSPHHGQVADVLGKLWHKAEQHHGASTSRRSGSSSGAVVV